MVSLVKTAVDPLIELDATYAVARKQAKERGATRMIVVILKNDRELYESYTVKTDNLLKSECVALLEIAKQDLIDSMR